MNSKLLVGFVAMLMVVSQPLSLLVAGNAPGGGVQDTTHGANPRATVETWAETDWSGGKVNTSQDVELELTSGEAVLSSDIGNMVPLFSPTAKDGIYSMVGFNGSLFLSSSSPGSGSSEIYSCDEITLICNKVTTLTEDMVYDMSVSANGTRLYIPGALQKNAAFNGSVYVYDGKKISRLDVKDAFTRSVGVRSVVELSGKLYAASVDNDNRAYVYRSLDDGLTWTKVQNLGARPYPRTMNAMDVLGDTIYAQTDGLATEGPKVLSYNGSGWVTSTLPGMTSNYGAFATIGGIPYFLVDGYLFSYKSGAWTSVPSPTSPEVSGTAVYDITTDTFQKGPDLLLPRFGHTSDLSKGKVVTAGGLIGQDVVDSTELYDAMTGAVSQGNPISMPRAFHASVVTKDGMVVVIGGMTGQPPTGFSATTSIERYNVTLDQWSVASSMIGARWNHTATLLKDGRVLVAGGQSSPTNSLATVGIYDPVGNSWTNKAPMHFARANHTATLLQNGTVLVLGGGALIGGNVLQVELYNATTDKWYQLSNAPFGIWGMTATLMADGNVLVSGGSQSAVFNTASSTWGSIINMGASRGGQTSTALPGGKVLVTAGDLGNTATIFTSASSSWAPSTSTYPYARPLGYQRAVVLNSTTILFLGGKDDLWNYYSLYNGLHFSSALSAYGKSGLVTATSGKDLYVHDASGNWTDYTTSTTYSGIQDLMVSHGRLMASTVTPATVLVAAASPSGTLVSRPHTFGGYSTNATINWDALLPTGTEVKFQVRSAKGLGALGTADFLGPDGTNASYFTSSNTNLGAAHIGHNVFQYKAFLSTSDAKVSPILQDISIAAVVEPLSLRSIVVTPSDVTITTDQYVKFNATGFDQFGTTMNIVPVWTATGGAMDPATGNYTPKFSGDWKVHASVVAVEGIANITVDPGALKTIKVTPDKWIGTTDDTKEFEALGLDAKGNTVPFTPKWALTGGGTITQGGNFTPTKQGTWTIYANDTASGISGNASALISLGNPASITVIPSDIEVIAGEHKQFKASVFDLDGNVVNFPIEWRLNGGGIINVNGNFTGQVAGNWFVYANISQYKLSAYATVKVLPGPLASVQVSPTETSIKAGESANFTAKPLDAFGNHITTSITWSASGGGPVTEGLFTPTKAGVWTVYANSSGSQGIAIVHVRPGPLFKLIVTPSQVNLTTNNWTMFTAQGEDRFGNVINGMTLFWAVTSGVGFIDQSGGLTAGAKKASGTVTVTGSYDNATVSGTAIVTVTPPKEPAKETTPGYYMPLELVIIGTMVAVVALIAVELSKKDDPNKK